jgi:radical SAM enzyme (rSAM/lipoprotein system)
LDALLAAGLHSITVSLDGFEENHNWLRGHPKSFKHALEAIRMLTSEKELVWDVVTCANGKDLSALPEFKDYLYELGVRNWRMFTIFPAGRAASSPELQLSDEEFTSLLNFIHDSRKEGKVHVSYGCEGFLGGYELEVRDNLYQCNAGICVASILADGSISTCPSIRADFHQGNIYIIYMDDFMDVWSRRFQVFRDRSWTKQGYCADCSLFRYCEGNGMHLHDGDGRLLLCHYNIIV